MSAKKLPGIFAGCLLVFLSYVAFAADSSILDFLPAVLHAQQAVNPVGTWQGTGKASYGMCGCDLNKITFTVQENTRAGTYSMGMAIDSGDAVCDQNCYGVNQTMTNIPATLLDNKLVFTMSYFATWYLQQGTPTRMLAVYSGEIDFSGSTAKFIIKDNYTQLDTTDNPALFSMVGSGTLTRQ